VKDWLMRRWKPLALVAIAFALYGVAKVKPELQLEQKLLETLQHIVEAAPE
jgi:hypothetical protein